MTMTTPDKQEISRNPDGTFVKGISGNPNGRPKAKTIKERVSEWLEEHPDDMDVFVAHFIKNNRELAWQMLEGKPPQKTDLTTDGERLVFVPAELLSKHAIDTASSSEPDSQ